VHFTPRNRSIVSTKPALPTSRTRQQTLTQIDFVARYVPEEDVDLNYIEEEVSRKRKRRRTLPAEDAPATVETRASRRRKVKQEVENESNDSAATTGAQVNVTQTQSSPESGEIRPPTTPVTIRKVEIPSSQSPADTPLSTQSTRSIRSPLRSPLKAKSTNARVPLVFSPKARQAVGWHPKLEVKSSVSWENEDSQHSTTVPSPRKANQTKNYLVTSNASRIADGHQEGHDDTQGVLLQSTSASENVNRSTQSSLPIDQPPAHLSAKTEIRDSDDEDEEEEVEEDYEMGNETQGVVHGLLQSSEHLQTDSDLDNCVASRGAGSIDEPDTTLRQHHEEEDSPFHDKKSLPDGDDVDKRYTQAQHQTSNHTLRTESHSNTHPALRSESEEVSAQLTNDLYHQTQHNTLLTLSPRLLDSQSQFGFVWRDYTHSLPEVSPEQEHEHDSSPIRNTTPNLPLEEDLRTSQVSTIDGNTQPPQSQTSTPQQQFFSSQLHPPESLHQSSPPPFPPLPSPSRFRAGAHDLDLGDVDVGEGRGFDGYDGYDGKVLTVSQLLPESMLNESESLGMVPFLDSQESLEGLE